MALQYKIAFAAAIKLNAGTRISWFLFTPMASKDRCSAEVPVEVVIAYLEPVNLTISFSNFLT